MTDSPLPGGMTLPDTLPGHWMSVAGHEMAQRYAVMDRCELAGGDRTDMEAAYDTAMIMRSDLDHEARLSVAKDRIRWLSVQLALVTARQRKLETERDEAIRDRNAHAEHVRRMAQECNDGLAALTEIDECWEACGLPGNRGKLSLSEQIASLSREGSADYERAEAAETRVRELEEALRKVLTEFAAGVSLSTTRARAAALLPPTLEA